MKNDVFSRATSRLSLSASQLNSIATKSSLQLICKYINFIFKKFKKWKFPKIPIIFCCKIAISFFVFYFLIWAKLSWKLHVSLKKTKELMNERFEEIEKNYVRIYVTSWHQLLSSDVSMLTQRWRESNSSKSTCNLPKNVLPLHFTLFFLGTNK